MNEAQEKVAERLERYRRDERISKRVMGERLGLAGERTYTNWLKNGPPAWAPDMAHVRLGIPLDEVQVEQRPPSEAEAVAQLRALRATVADLEERLLALERRAEDGEKSPAKSPPPAGGRGGRGTRSGVPRSRK